MVKLAIATTIYLASVVLANVLTDRYGLVPAGFGLTVTAGTYAAGAALLARDFVHRYSSVPYVLGAIAVAGALSWWLASASLALASTTAFLAAELVDLGVFTPARRRTGFVPAALASNIVSAPVDTVVFLAIAGFPLTWATITGQLVAKILWATLVPLALWVAASALPRQPLQPGRR